MRLLGTMILWSLYILTSAQNIDSIEKNSFEYHLIPPSYNQGEAAKKKFISEHLVYPEAAKENRLSGVVELKFIVEKDGSLTNFEIVKDPGRGLGNEAQRIYQLMPLWNPGILYGEPARVPITESIKFKIYSRPSQPIK